MISKLFDAMFAPKHPRGYTGRHRAVFVPVRAVKPRLSPATAITARKAVVH
jgi:hypothetical protein